MPIAPLASDVLVLVAVPVLDWLAHTCPAIKHAPPCVTVTSSNVTEIIEKVVTIDVLIAPAFPSIVTLQLAASAVLLGVSRVTEGMR